MMECYVYSWHVDERETNVTSIRVFGVNEQSENVCLKIDDFTPYVYVSLPTHIEWDVGKAAVVGSRIDILTRDRKPLMKRLIFKKKLYYANVEEKTNWEEQKKFPFLFLSFACLDDIRMFSWKIKNPIIIAGIGPVQLNLHEYIVKKDIPNYQPILQLVSQRQIPTTGWVSFLGKETEEDDKRTRCKREYSVKWKTLNPVKKDSIPKICVFSFDLEVNSSRPPSMPKAGRKNDKIFQIGVVVSDKIGVKKYLLSLGNPSFVEGCTVLTFSTESNLIIGFKDLALKYCPNVMIGYNIFGFDIPYMIERSKGLGVFSEFDQISLVKYAHSIERNISWSSSAYKNQNFHFLDFEGILLVDLLPVIKRDYNHFNNYKLKTVSTHFLGQTKDPLTPEGIFLCYRKGMEGTDEGRKALEICGKYCVQDSNLPLLLFEKLSTWIGLCEMAKTCNVPIFFLFTLGQQIKVFSQLYAKCTRDNIVVEKNGYVSKDDEHYTGAMVFPPVPGIYDRVVPFDFSSLYPTTIIAYNIDYTTLAKDNSIPDDKCHIIEWEDHQNCIHDQRIIRINELTVYITKEKTEITKLREQNKKKAASSAFEATTGLRLKHEIEKRVRDLKPYTEERTSLMKSKPKHNMCAKRRYRFIKSPIGVLPSLLKHLLEARSATRKEGKSVKEEISKTLDVEKKNSLETYYTVLDMRQLAFKVSANSMYGIMGTKVGDLAFLIGAMATTSMGRKSISLVAKVIPEKFGGKLIYGDSVSGDTPILIRYENKTIDLKSIEELGREWFDYPQFKKEDSSLRNKQQSLVDIEVWTGKKWSKVKRVVRHNTKKKMFRVSTQKGCVDVTEDHSLIDSDGKCIKPERIILGRTELFHSFPTTFIEYDINVVSGIGKTMISQNCITLEEAFLWGCFMKHGEILCEPKDKNKGIIFHSVKLQECFRKIEGLDSIAKRSELFYKYKQLFYRDGSGLKNVPYPILNASYEIKKSFSDGYLSRDCHTEDTFTDIVIGKLGAQGMYTIWTFLGYNVSVFSLFPIKNDEYAFWCSPQKYNLVFMDKEYLMYTVNEVILLPSLKENDSSGRTSEAKYVYDLETEEGVFHAGIGELILKNTDSSYVAFPHLKDGTAEDIWKHSEYVSKEVSKLFPPPMNLAFEEVIYWRFLILTKKRYMSIACKKDGVVSKEIKKKGVLLARRDYSAFVRDVYETVIIKIFDGVDRDDLLFYILNEINKLCSGTFLVKKKERNSEEKTPYRSVPLEKEDSNASEDTEYKAARNAYFIITQSVGETDNLDDPKEFINEKGVKKGKVGDYTVPLLTEDNKEHQYDLKRTTVDKEYYLRCLPAQVQLAEKMKRRGQIVEPGTRLEYVVVDSGDVKDKKYEKVEHIDYFNEYSSIIKIDYFYYLKQLAKPLDQVLNVLYLQKEGVEKKEGYKFTKNFVDFQYKFRLNNRRKLLEEYKNLIRRKIKIEVLE